MRTPTAPARRLAPTGAGYTQITRGAGTLGGELLLAQPQSLAPLAAHPAALAPDLPPTPVFLRISHPAPTLRESNHLKPEDRR